VKFVLNLSLTPFFAAVFDEENILIEKIFCRELKNSSAKIWNFLQKFEIKKIAAAGGICGPGGFSSLRAAATILNSIAFSQKISLFSMRADFFLKKILQQKNLKNVDFLLNSFSNNIFFRDKNENLQQISVEIAAEKFRDQKFLVDFLPPEKQKFFRKINLKLENLEKNLLKILLQQRPKKVFLPEYFFPAV